MSIDQHLLDAVSALEQAAEVEKATAHSALDRGDLGASKSAIERVEAISELIEAVTALVSVESTDKRHSVDRRNLGRLPKGTKTPDGAFRLPILEAISDLGGSASVGDILDRVGQILSSRLRPVDMEGLPSDPDQPRWRNTAQWERLTMVKEGLLRDDSARGVWEITEAGRRYLLAGGRE